MQVLGRFEGKRIVEKDGKLYWYPPDVRECVIAGPGRKLVISDFAQIEVRVIAFFSQEPAMLKALNEKKDIHCFMASQVYGEPYDLLFQVAGETADKPKDKKHPRYNELSMMRADVKNITFMIPYGAKEQGIALKIRKKDGNGQFIETEEAAIARATILRRDYFAQFSELEYWLEEQKIMAQTQGYTSTVIGRRRYYTIPHQLHPDYNKLMGQIARWAGNQPVQGASADILKDAVGRLYRAHRGDDLAGPKILDANILLVCHDEIVTDAAEKDLDRAEEMLVTSMSSAYQDVWMNKRFRNGEVKPVYLKDIYNQVSAIVADYWAKD